MTHLDLSPRELEIVVAVLDHELADLTYEIGCTDGEEYLPGLEEKRAVLQKAIEALAAPRLPR
jgi:hypothetical protein